MCLCWSIVGKGNGERTSALVSLSAFFFARRFWFLVILGAAILFEGWARPQRLAKLTVEPGGCDTPCVKNSNEESAQIESLGQASGVGGKQRLRCCDVATRVAAVQGTCSRENCSSSGKLEPVIDSTRAQH